MHFTTADIWNYKSNWKTMYIYSNQRKYNQKKKEYILYIKILKLQEKPSHRKLNKKK